MSGADLSPQALLAINHIPAAVAYWSPDLHCVFANNAYREWFGRSPAEMLGISAQVLLGTAFEQSLPHFHGVLRGETQVFERQFQLEGGQKRDSIVTYTPDLADGRVRGFCVHVADITRIRLREPKPEAPAAAPPLRRLVPICSSCKSIRDPAGIWHRIEEYFARTGLIFTHGLCLECARRFFEHDQPSSAPSDPAI